MVRCQNWLPAMLFHYFYRYQENRYKLQITFINLSLQLLPETSLYPLPHPLTSFMTLSPQSFLPPLRTLTFSSVLVTTYSKIKWFFIQYLCLKILQNQLSMDIQIENTPPKKFQGQNPSTPPRHYDTQAYNTPVKRKHQVTTPVKGSGQNPQSKKFKILHSIQKPSNSSNRRISEFNLSRLEKDYIYERKLGEGNFSFVGLYKSRMTGDFFAVKITKSSKMSVNEVQALGALSILSQRCKNIVRYFHSWVENNELHLVMEYCKESLTTLLDRQRYSGLRFKEEFIKNVLKQSLQGLKTMHENKMVHLDLKPDNLLIKENVIKISDLGLTRLNHLKRASELDEGDSRYLAREVLNYYPSIDLTKADIFSLGLTIFQMLSLEPLPNNGEYWVSIRDHGLSLTDRMDLQQYSSELLSLVEQMIHPDWSCRPSASDLLQSPLLKDQFPRRNRMMVFNTKNHKNRKNESSL